MRSWFGVLCGFGIALLLEACGMSSPALRAPPTPGSTTTPAVSSDRSTVPVSLLAPAGVSVGQPAPDFALANLGGQTVRLSDFQGRPVALSFFATWCGPCKEELPQFQAAYQQYRDRGFQVILVDLKESPADVAAFTSKAGLTMPVLVDERGTVAAEKYRLTGLPSTIFVDANGVIRGVQTGPLVGTALNDNVTALLGGATMAATSQPSGECCALP